MMEARDGSGGYEPRRGGSLEKVKMTGEQFLSYSLQKEVPVHFRTFDLHNSKGKAFFCCFVFCFFKSLRLW